MHKYGTSHWPVSHSSIAYKQLKISSDFFLCQIAPSFQFLSPSSVTQFQGEALCRGIKQRYRMLENIAIFSQFLPILETVQDRLLNVNRRKSCVPDQCHQFWWPRATLKGGHEEPILSSWSQYIHSYCLTNNDQNRHCKPRGDGRLLRGQGRPPSQAKRRARVCPFLGSPYLFLMTNRDWPVSPS